MNKKKERERKRERLGRKLKKKTFARVGERKKKGKEEQKKS